MVTGAATASPGTLLEMRIPEPHLRNFGGEALPSRFNKPESPVGR